MKATRLKNIVRKLINEQRVKNRQAPQAKPGGRLAGKTPPAQNRGGGFGPNIKGGPGIKAPMKGDKPLPEVEMCLCCPEEWSQTTCVDPDQCPPVGQLDVVHGGYCYPNPEHPDVTQAPIWGSNIATDCSERLIGLTLSAPSPAAWDHPDNIFNAITGWHPATNGNWAIYNANKACPGGESQYLEIFETDSWPQ
jgi:hypothetical protein